MHIVNRIAFDSKEEKKQLFSILTKYKSDDDKPKAIEELKTEMGLKSNLIIAVMDRFWKERFNVAKKYGSR